MSKNLYNSNLPLQVKQTIHDLNNIFLSSINSTEILEKLFADNPKASKLIATIKVNSLRAVDIINNLSENSVKQKRNISLNDIISDIKSTIKSTLPKGIKLQFRLGKQLNKVNANYTDLYRMFLNLIVNSIESIEDSGTIIFSVKNSRKKDSILISIKDDGIGISKRRLKNIFTEGFSTKKKKSNSGFGLSIVKKIIEEHNGTIDVVSEIKTGTEFIITLPAIEKIKVEQKKSYTILLADDDKVILELFSDLLTSYNYKVITAENGKAAISKFKKNKCDLVIVDKTMPDIDGIACITKIRKLNPEIPIILTTGSQETMDMDLSDLNINRKIKKPWSFDDMFALIQSLLV